MSTTETKEKILVWTKTERAGDIVTVNGVDGEFTTFTDGSRVFTNIIGQEFFMEAKSLEHATSLAQPFKAPGSVINQAPVTKAKVPVTIPTEPVVNVMLEMLKKMSAKNTISMPLNLNVPSQEVYNLFKDQMDITKADLNEQILALVMSQIDNLQQQLKPQAEQFIKQYYNGERNTTSTTSSVPDARSTSRKPKQSGPDINY